MFPLSEAYPIRHTSVRYFVDDMREHRNTPDFALSKEIRLTRFRSIAMLDLAAPDVFQPRPWQRKILDIPPRPRMIDLVPPLDIPYDALDIRQDRVIPRDKKHADIFTRRLPYALMMKRSAKETRNWTIRHRRGIIATCVTVLMMVVPTGIFIRYAVMDGYAALTNLRSAINLTEVRTHLRTARDDFERANFLFFPFSWIPGETVDLANRAIH